VDFFCHAWDYNTYKHKKINYGEGEQPVYWAEDILVDRNELVQTLQLFNPKKFHIDDKSALPDDDHFFWHSLTYSMMYANYLKKQYEIENNFRYAYVIKTRYDTIFRPDMKFVLNTMPPPQLESYLEIFVGHKARMAYEYNRMNSDDTFFYGTSLAMDIFTDLYVDMFLKHRRKHIRLDDEEYLGPGSAMSEFASERNIDIIPDFGLETIVYRKEMEPADPLTQYTEIKKFSDSMYV
jgi:hypothetical protein